VKAAESWTCFRLVGATLLLSSCLTRRVAAQQRWQDGYVPAAALQGGYYVDQKKTTSQASGEATTARRATAAGSTASLPAATPTPRAGCHTSAAYRLNWWGSWAVKATWSIAWVRSPYRRRVWGPETEDLGVIPDHVALLWQQKPGHPFADALLCT